MNFPTLPTHISANMQLMREGISIRNLTKAGDADAVTAIQQIQTEIRFCALTYTGVELVHNGSVAKECTNFVVKSKKLGVIRVPEIRNAFRMAAAGELTGENGKVVEVNGYGKFTAEILGKVLSAYLSYRAGAILEAEKELAKAEHAQREQREQAANEQAKTDVIKTFTGMLEFGFYFESPDAVKVQFVVLAKCLHDAGLIQHDKAEQNAAFVIAENEYKAKSVAGANAIERLNATKVLESLNKADTVLEFDNRVRSLYIRRVIYKTLLDSAMQKICIEHDEGKTKCNGQCEFCSRIFKAFF
jgi:hypothetical protein